MDSCSFHGKVGLPLVLINKVLLKHSCVLTWHKLFMAIFICYKVKLSEVGALSHLTAKILIGWSYPETNFDLCSGSWWHGNV